VVISREYFGSTFWSYFRRFSDNRATEPRPLQFRINQNFFDSRCSCFSRYQ
jgi:hypothetical protein